MVEGAALEMLYRGNSIVGSNPTLSAIFMLKFGKSAHLCPFFWTRIFYCDPYSAFQKPHVENNHLILRNILEKRTSFDDLE